MADIITTGETELSEGERRAERDLGTVINELEHLAKDVAEHTTTIEGLRQDRQWMNERIEAFQRDLEAAPKLPEELTRTFSDAISDITTRLDRLEEANTHNERTTDPPEHHHHEDEDEEEHDENGEHRERKRQSLLDRLF